jgi:hypothetical protein
VDDADGRDRSQSLVKGIGPLLKEDACWGIASQDGDGFLGGGIKVA